MTGQPDTGGFGMTNHVVNPVLGWVLRSPMGRHTGRHLALLSYVGRLTGRRHELVVQYAREGAEVWIVPGQPQRKRWWRNFRTSGPVELRLAGDVLHGRAVVLDNGHPDELRRGVSAYLRHVPRASKALAADSDSAVNPDSLSRAGRMVVVHVVLDGAGASGDPERLGVPGP